MWKLKKGINLTSKCIKSSGKVEKIRELVQYTLTIGSLFNMR